MTFLSSLFSNLHSTDQQQQKALRAAYEAGVAENRRLPMFKNGESILFCDTLAQSAVLISREKTDGKTYRYFAEKYVISPFITLIKDYIDGSNAALGILAFLQQEHTGQEESSHDKNRREAFEAMMVPEYVADILDMRQRIEDSIPIIARETGRNISDALRKKMNATAQIDMHSLSRQEYIDLIIQNAARELGREALNTTPDETKADARRVKDDRKEIAAKRMVNYLTTPGSKN